MGWFSKSPSEPVVVHTKERRKCWEARDEFFACLDSNEIVDAIKDDKKARKACPAQLEKYENSCIETWIEYFKQKRVADHTRQQKIAELEAKGYRPLDTMQVKEVR
ncbi:Cytochrome c oxidase subunit 6B-like protein new16 [Wickerhamiella sorbophila]|uniref:Cytochrome c oxidase subunit 6B-like protein new16 n=1 Tax=Wickerhamiella sorbophila TaxID=45607 RepID=A0A2T0FDP0_9ASCO|nr:Cytochrome c oxidase subunit 6B-like protein new16 [Wickerhamiella sorbophila]PRT53128.1 Cytochrome c oxidase subunit 6B-like protein new16 [Wickerhamiella sorbophila]